MNIPKRYKTVDYIEATGTQYIDTNYLVQETDTIELDYFLTDNGTGTNFLFGTYAASDESTGNVWVSVYQNNKWYERFGSTSSTNHSLDLTNDYKGSLFLKKQNFTVNGTRLNQPSYNSMPTQTLVLFGCKRDDGTITTGKMRCKGFRIKNGSGNYVINYIPVVDTEQGFKSGMYDTISNTFIPSGDGGFFEVGVHYETNPIWKDTYLNLDDYGNGYVDYLIKVGEGDEMKPIYKGRCYRNSNYQCVIKLNEICRDYLVDNFTLLDTQTWIENTTGSIQFSIYRTFGLNEVLDSKMTFWNDWSYQDYVGSAAHYLSDPIQDYVDRRQYFVFTALFESGEVNVQYEGNINNTTTFDGIVKTYIDYLPNVDLYGDYNFDFNSDFLVYRYRPVDIDYTIDYNGYRTFRVKDTCCKYCLYYLNARGGWDWLLINGVDTKTNTYTRQTYNQNYNNTQYEFGKVNYRNDIKETWTLNTEYLTDAQSEKMSNLFGSIKVFLHNLEDNTIIPVVITNSSQTVKTFRNQGRKLYNYTISVENSQSKIRM